MWQVRKQDAKDMNMLQGLKPTAEMPFAYIPLLETKSSHVHKPVSQVHIFSPASTEQH